ncbi:MAG TPA: diacylglycerol kinase family protein [Flavobacterium sp.]|nr:diacylglycerol kinase family protein [Flavobacterium sp.]
MKNSTDGFLVGRLKSFRFAFKGAFLLLTTEHAIISQVFLALAFIIAGFLTGITKTEWMFQVFAIGLLLSIEGMNTAVEKLCDFIHPDHHHKIGFIKDIAAGAVTFAALTAMTIVIFIYFPYFYEKVF